MTKTAAPTITTEIVDITPDLALDWLSANTHNRVLREARAQSLADAIRRGEWVLNGDAIRFSEDGTLLDGQHRLWAIAEAEMTVRSVVVRGLPRETQDTMDHGARRSLSDVLTLRGESSTMVLAASVNYWWRYKNGYVRTPSKRPTVAQAIATLDAHPMLRESGSVLSRARSRFRVQTGPWTTSWYEFHSLDHDAAETFFDRLLDGIGLEEGSPILAMRRWLERQNANQAGGVRYTSTMLHALLIKAWNAYVRGDHVSQLSWRATGLNAEGFPQVVNPADLA
jgi:hypothetical protein